MPTAQLAIVIDDVGYHRQRGERAVRLPGPITLAVLPFTPHAQHLAQLAAQLGKDLIIHQPMEPQPSAAVREERDTLTLHMPVADFDAMVRRALDRFPERVGVSNHTGSLLTQHRAPMQRLMWHLQQRDLFFLDSRTTPTTVALDVARESGVRALRRDVFLDHDRREASVVKAFAKALDVARRKGSAVLVGHPYPVTLALLERELNKLPHDVELVSAARLARQRLDVAGVTSRVTLRQAAPARPADPASLHISPGR